MDIQQNFGGQPQQIQSKSFVNNNIVTVSEFLIFFILLYIPIVNIISFIVMLLSKKTKPSKKSLVRVYLVIYIIFYLISGVLIANKIKKQDEIIRDFDNETNYYEEDFDDLDAFSENDISTEIDNESTTSDVNINSITLNKGESTSVDSLNITFVESKLFREITISDTDNITPSNESSVFLALFLNVNNEDTNSTILSSTCTGYANEEQISTLYTGLDTLSGYNLDTYINAGEGKQIALIYEVPDNIYEFYLNVGSNNIYFNLF